MSRDYFKRLTTVEYTAWDLNCRKFVIHTKNRNNIERAIRRKARRKDKMALRKEIDLVYPV